MTADQSAHPPAAALALSSPRVQHALRDLDRVDELPPAAHVEVYESVHEALQEVLAGLVEA